MLIIEINALENGAHRNQTGDNIPVPNGWAEVSSEIVIPDTFPFVDLVFDEGTRKIVELIPGVVPEPEQAPEPTREEDMDAFMVDHEYRLTLLELGVTEGV